MIGSLEHSIDAQDADSYHIIVVLSECKIIYPFELLNSQQQMALLFRWRSHLN